jgi:hypothetical protein
MDRRESLSGKGLNPILRNEGQDAAVERVCKGAVVKKSIGGEFPMTFPLERIRAKVCTVVLGGLGD